MICPSCLARPLALFICDDNVHRCYTCKAKGITRRAAAPGIPVGNDAHAPSSPPQTEHTAIIQARVHLRNQISRMEGLTDWDKSPWNCGKHEGMSEALEILRRVGE